MDKQSFFKREILIDTLRYLYLGTYLFMKCLRAKLIYIVLLGVFFLGQTSVSILFFQQLKNLQQTFSQKELALKAASQKNKQIYCVGDWQAQFKANPFPPQNQHPILGFKQDPHLLFVFNFELSFSAQSYSSFFYSKLSSAFLLPELEPPRLS